MGTRIVFLDGPMAGTSFNEVNGNTPEAVHFSTWSDKSGERVYSDLHYQLVAGTTNYTYVGSTPGKPLVPAH